MFDKEKSKKKVNKKSFNRCLRSRSQYSSAININSFDFFVISLCNNINQSTTKNQNEKSEQKKISDTMKSYFKIIKFFQNVCLVKDRYSIKLNSKNSVFLCY